MNSTPIFDQLQAEFLEKSKYCRLRIGPPAGEGFVINDGVTEMAEIEEVSKPRLYIVDGAPELVDLTEADEETEVEKTMVMPRIEETNPKPPSMTMIDDTRVIPAVEDEEESTALPEDDHADTSFEPVSVEPEATQHVFPVKRIHHKKNSAIGPFSFFNRAA